MNRVIVIGTTHHNSLGVIRALGERGYEVEFVNFGGNNRDYVSKSKYIRKYRLLKSIEQVCVYLMSRPVSSGKEVIIPCADAVTEHLNLHIEELGVRYIFPGVPQQGRMVELMDKITMIEMAAKREIYAPPVWYLPDDVDKVTFPCITKCHVSSHGRKSDIVILLSKEELDAYLQRADGELFAQAYINKKEEVQLIGCSLRGGEEVIIPGMSKIIRSQPNTNTGFLEYGPLNPFYEDIVEKAKLYIRDCQYSGLFSFEIMRSIDDKIWFLEINFRNDGNAWCVTKSGVNLPVIWVKSCLGEEYQSEIQEPNHLLMMPEFQDLKMLLQRKVSFNQWIKDCKRTDCFMEYDKTDKTPFYAYFYYNLANRLTLILSGGLGRDGGYLIRLDDACPTMDAKKWKRMEAMLDAYGVKPMVGVIPANNDRKQMIDDADSGFWNKVKVWEKKGWAIALHGYDHCFISDAGMKGLNPLWKRSEFAGVSLEVQKEKIRKGVSVFRENGIEPKYFFAPAHTYDENTLQALREESSIRIISDTIATEPYRKDDFVFIPQLGGRCSEMKLPGVWTFCLHPSAMKEEDFLATEKFLHVHKDEVLGFDQLNLTKLKGKNLISRLLSWAYFIRRRMKGTK